MRRNHIKNKRILSQINTLALADSRAVENVSDRGFAGLYWNEPGFLLAIIKKELCRQHMQPFTLRNRAIHDMVTSNTENKDEMREQIFILMGFIWSMQNVLDKKTFNDSMTRAVRGSLDNEIEQSAADDSLVIICEKAEALTNYNSYLENYSTKLIELRNRSFERYLQRESTPASRLACVAESTPDSSPEDIRLLYAAARHVMECANRDANTQAFKDRILNCSEKILVNPFDQANLKELNKIISENQEGKISVKNCLIGAAVILASVAVVAGLITACVMCPPLMAAVLPGYIVYHLCNSLLAATVIAGITGICTTISGIRTLFQEKESGTQVALKDMRSYAKQSCKNAMKFFKVENRELQRKQKQDDEIASLGRDGTLAM